ncbi:MAG: protein-disulfide reductase DsbD family protein [Thermoguttaceae bacterium]
MLLGPALGQWGQKARGFGFGRGGPGPVSISAQFAIAKDGQPARIFVTAQIDQGWHIYSITQPAGGPLRTRIKLEQSDQFRQLGDFVAHQAPATKTQPEAFGDLPVESHEGHVVWSAPIQIAAGVDPAAVRITGTVVGEACDVASCRRIEIPFTAALGPGMEVPDWVTAGAAFDPAELQKHIEQNKAGTSLWVQLLAGFLGGIILNLMPCVLPVIGLKILAFVEQAGHDRRTAFLLNCWYSLGLLLVFWALAALAVLPSEVGGRVGWGQLFQRPGFNVFIAALVFTMALAFLGVWEFPVPGFMGRGRAIELAEREGAIGAFSKGVITTLLATPCTGPFMGGALAWALGKPAAVVFAVFSSVGLGMASPYLLIGVFPKLVRLIPKPGPWMDTFKQLMGFVLLGTVVFVLSFMHASYVVPTVGLLFALWLACWWIARTPAAAPLGVKWRAWLEGTAIVGLAWLLLFHVRFTHQLPWQPFTTRAGFERLVASGNTVLVDFTADWCATCKTLEALYLNTKEVRQLVERNRVVTLKADWTHEDPEVTAMLNLLGAQQVPVVAIFPAGRPNEPIRFLDGYTKGMILEALQKAGPSRPASSSSAKPQTASS